MNRMVREQDGQWRILNGYGQKAEGLYRGWELRCHRQVSGRQVGGARLRSTALVWVGHLDFRGIALDSPTFPSAGLLKRNIDWFWKTAGSKYGWKEQDVHRKSILA